MFYRTADHQDLRVVLHLYMHNYVRRARASDGSGMSNVA
jgi:hypothetical protein